MFMLLLEHTNVTITWVWDKSVQPAQLLGLSSGPKFYAFKAGCDFQNF